MSAEERERRQQRGELWGQINAALEAAKDSLHGAAGCYTGSPSFWFHRHCKAVLGASPNAMDNVQLPDALALATWMREAAAKFDRAAPAGMTYEARGAAARDLLRRAADEYRAQAAPAAGPKWKGARSVPLKAPAPQYEKSGRIQALEKVNPTDRQVRGVRLEQSKTSEEKDMALNGSTAAPVPQPERPSPGRRINAPRSDHGGRVEGGNLVIPLQFADVEGMGMLASNFCEEAKQVFIDIEVDEAREGALALAILGLSAAAAIVDRLTEIARHAPEVTP